MVSKAREVVNGGRESENTLVPRKSCARTLGLSDRGCYPSLGLIFPRGEISGLGLIGKKLRPLAFVGTGQPDPSLFPLCSFSFPDGPHTLE